VTEAIRPLIASKQHVLDVELPTHPLRVDADPVRLEQVLGNLLANAAKYTDNGGAIFLSARREGPFVAIRVRDTGIGIEPELLPHVFDLFTQAFTNVDRSQGGLGIGLTLVKNLVELHGGSVAASSEGPGRGSEFTIRLPAVVDEESSAPAGSEKGPPTAPVAVGPVRRILVVDDSADTAQSLAMLLNASGYEVESANDGPSALAAARRFRPAFILLDIGMPGMSGYELARTLRKNKGTRKTTLVAISGFGRPEDVERSREAGFDHHLLKPVDLDTLIPILTDPKKSTRRA
jgi:CheY-like chemotaxis protein